ncbi:sensor histidine kinase [Bacillus xiapuensis]|uniref:sensor histidine kinase n=1 Tax=Bacillus xiapuensis TaxID=2014075 RepID=UPI000C233407|nr:sensor histidine kinase [Bacillus xiapuensis]
MIRNYLIERRSWIALFVFIQLLTLFITLVDPSIPFASVLYLTFLSSLVFLFFLWIRYHKETRFYKELTERNGDLDAAMPPAADSPLERLISESLLRQTEHLKRKATANELALEQEKDELLSWIHEVKTPLTAMYLMMDRLQDEALKADLIRQWLRIHLLLDQQLHQKRILFMTNDLYIEQTDLESLLFGEIKSLQPWCIQKRIGFDIDLQSTTVLSDAKWLAFIIRQLLTNAVKYSEASDISIKSNQQHGQTVLMIQDSGRGIDPKDLPRIFEKGFTSTTRHDDSAATGMGLYLTKKAAQPLHIRIEVQSELGKGTTFTLIFPKQNDFVELTSM